MTRHSDRKTLIRAHLAITGKAYTEAERLFNEAGYHGDLNIPDTADPLQRYLEASLLLAWADVAWLYHWSGRDLRSFVRMTDPAPNRLTIGVSDVELLRPLLGRVLPVRVGHSMMGIPGIRTHLSGGRLELRLHSPRNEVRAAVRFTGPSHDDFTDVIGGLAAGHALFGTDSVRDLRERAMFHGPRLQNASVLSGILRRISMWRTATQLRLRDTGRAVVVSWQERPDERAASAILDQSQCAIDECEAWILDAHSIALRPVPGRSRSRSRSRHGELWPEWLRTCRPRNNNMPGRQAIAPCYDPGTGAQRFRMTPDVDDAVSSNNLPAVEVLCRRVGLSEDQTERFVAAGVWSW